MILEKLGEQIFPFVLKKSKSVYPPLLCFPFFCFVFKFDFESDFESNFESDFKSDFKYDFESDLKTNFESNFESDFGANFGSDNLISLRYSVAAFSVNLFWLFCYISYKNPCDKWWEIAKGFLDYVLGTKLEKRTSFLIQ